MWSPAIVDGEPRFCRRGGSNSYVSSPFCNSIDLIAWLSQLTRQLNVRFEERFPNEPDVRLARHALAGFCERFDAAHVAADHLPPEFPGQAPRPCVLELMGQVIDEGRHAVRDLRHLVMVAL